MSYKGRDIELLQINPNQYLTVACDSCGAIGSKELDLVKVSPYIVGRFTTRVALLEIVTTGGRPQLATIAISNEPAPTGTEILGGVRDELASFGLSALPLAVSTEKNILTRQTGLGVSVVGLCERADLRIARTTNGDLLYCLGLPKVGPEVESPDDPEIVQSFHVQKLLQDKEIHDIIPVGSKGVGGEAELLASSIAGHLMLNPSVDIDLQKSAGPSTCLIFSTASPFPAMLFDSIPCHPIGRVGP
jgi:Selenophosphate synthetase-related proteins